MKHFKKIGIPPFLPSKVFTIVHFFHKKIKDPFSKSSVIYKMNAA